jgi:hypothetical protein
MKSARLLDVIFAGIRGDRTSDSSNVRVSALAGIFLNTFLYLLAQIIIYTVQLHVTGLYFSKLPCVFHTKRNLKWTEKKVHYDIANRMCNYSFSLK